MRITELGRNDNYEDNFSNLSLLKGFEGGSVYSSEKNGKHYLILDESTMAAILDEEDLPDCLVKIIEFDTIEERDKYIKQRSWG
tara:strand:- start:784 stop:1035 length:252 start_codon:yes stop_codon:yes gene_type:complete